MWREEGRTAVSSGGSKERRSCLFVCHGGHGCDEAFSHEPILNLVEIYV
jgi:hypothetical protein